MADIYVLISNYLIQNEGPKAKGPGLIYSFHKEASDKFIQWLNELNVDFEVWSENDLFTKSDKKNDDYLLIPKMRTCNEPTFNKLVELADRGWKIFTTIDSFYYKTPDIRVIDERIRRLFQLPDTDSTDSVQSIKVSDQQVIFAQTPFAWLTKGIPSPLNCSTGFVLGINGESKFLNRHGTVSGLIEEKTKESGKEIIRKVRRVYPVFLIREYESGGVFIYSSILITGKEAFKQFILNFCKKKDTSSRYRREIQWLKGCIVVLCAIMFLLLSILIFGPALIANIVSSLVGGVVTWLLLKMTSSVDKWSR